MIANAGIDKFFCFTKDGATHDYPILLVEMVKKREGDKDIVVAMVRDRFPAGVTSIGKIEVVLAGPTRLVDFSSFLPIVRSVEIFAGLQQFEVLSIELPMGFNSTRFLEVAVIPGTVFGIMWQGLIKSAADYHRCCQDYWANRSQLRLPFDEEESKFVRFSIAVR